MLSITFRNELGVCVEEGGVDLVLGLYCSNGYTGTYWYHRLDCDTCTTDITDDEFRMHVPRISVSLEVMC